MSVIVTDTGFGPDTFNGKFTPLADLPAPDAGPIALDLGPADKLAALSNRLANITLIRVAFPAFSDGRGFTLARQLREMGYRGRLRAFGYVLPDQYAMARRAGFDEVEISDELAERLTEDDWKRRANWRAHDYQARLRA